jgi:hypothetical protein
MTNHPITPPLELVMQWSNASPIPSNDENWAYELFIADQASKWAADQELEACCEWLKLEGHEHEHEALLAARRPKPPSLKEQALVALHAVATGANDMREQRQDFDTIRRALEALPD